MKVKRIISLLLASLLVLTVFTACKKDDDLGWITSFDCEDGYSWTYEFEKEGIMELVTSEYTPTKEGEEQGKTMFVFEPVGAGETTVTFRYISNDGGEVKQTVKYKVSVNDNYEYVATLLEETDNTVPAVKLETPEDAEQYISDELGVEDKETGNEIVVEYEDSYEDENGKKWYVFRASMVVTDEETGKTYLRFMKLYAVSENGEIKELPDPEDTADREINLK